MKSPVATGPACSAIIQDVRRDEYITMNTMPNERLARYVFGQLRLIDLWEVSGLEGLMTLNRIERMTAGLNDTRSHVIFFTPKGDRFTFDAGTPIKLDGRLPPSVHLPNTEPGRLIR